MQCVSINIFSIIKYIHLSILNPTYFIFISKKPVETCTLDPQQNCRHVTILVPTLKPVDECVDVPKEVCSRSRTNPHVVKKPVVKKWCYTPSAESGLGK